MIIVASQLLMSISVKLLQLSISDHVKGVTPKPDAIDVPISIKQSIRYEQPLNGGICKRVESGLFSRKFDNLDSFCFGALLCNHA